MRALPLLIVSSYLLFTDVGTVFPLPVFNFSSDHRLLIITFGLSLGSDVVISASGPDALIL